MLNALPVEMSFSKYSYINNGGFTVSLVSVKKKETLMRVLRKK